MGACPSNSCLRSPTAEAEMARMMEQERKEGRELLQQMVTKSGDQIDWVAVIAKAHELHAKEQVWLRKQGLSHQRIFEIQQQRALRKRKRYDSVGSFSVNLLTYRSAHASPTATLLLSTRSLSSSSSHTPMSGMALPAPSMSKSRSLPLLPEAAMIHPKDAESNRSRTATVATATGSCDDQNSTDDSYNIAEFQFNKSHNDGMEPIDEQTEVTMEL